MKLAIVLNVNVIKTMDFVIFLHIFNGGTINTSGNQLTARKR